MPRRKAAIAEAGSPSSVYQVPWPMMLTSRCSGPNRRFLTLVRALRLTLCSMTMPACAAEQLDHFPVECREIIGAAARDQPLVHDRFLVHPVCAGVLEVCFERGP